MYYSQIWKICNQLLFLRLITSSQNYYSMTYFQVFGFSIIISLPPCLHIHPKLIISFWKMYWSHSWISWRILFSNRIFTLSIKPLFRSLLSIVKFYKNEKFSNSWWDLRLVITVAFDCSSHYFRKSSNLSLHHITELHLMKKCIELYSICSKVSIHPSHEARTD